MFRTAAAAALGLAALAGPAAPQQSSDSPAAAISETSRTFRSHSVAAGAQANFLEGAACPAGSTMLSGACHPGFSSSVRIVNQFPNVAGNTWRCGFRNATAQQRTVWVYTLCGEEGAPPGPPLVTHNLQVRRFESTPLTNAEADNALSDGTTVLQTNDGPGDVACNVALTRNGNVTGFNTGDGSIDSQAEFSAVIALPGEVKAVNQINWCGGLAPNIIGCAPVPGDSLTVVRFTPSLEGILWAHEFGHNKGRSHRNGVDNVMHPSIGASRVQVNQAECDAFRAAPLVVAAAGAPQPQADGGEEPAPPDDVREFVRQIFFHGVPYDQASSYGVEAVPTLVEMLNDPDEKEFWPNVVVTLGMIGEPEAVEPMISFIEAEAEGELDRAHYMAKASGIMALGYIVNETGDQRAFDYLVDSLDPGRWRGEELGRAPFQASVEERDEDFSTKAILGLALAGEAGRQALERMREPGDSPTARAFQSQVDALVDQALDENRAIAEQGLERYYEDRHRD